MARWYHTSSRTLSARTVSAILSRDAGIDLAPRRLVAEHESRTAVLAAIVGNAALAALKAGAALTTGSAAMLAETFHSVCDTGNQALLLLGMRLARRPPDARHPLGHGQNVYFWSFVVSMLLFSVGGAFSIWEGGSTCATTAIPRFPPSFSRTPLPSSPSCSPRAASWLSS